MERVARDRIHERAVGEDIVGPSRMIGETGAGIESVPVIHRHRRRGLERRHVRGASRNAGRQQQRCNHSNKLPHGSPPLTPNPVSMFPDDINRCRRFKSNTQAAQDARLQFASVHRATSVFDRSKFELI
jgi:hypothetical protein